MNEDLDYEYNSVYLICFRLICISGQTVSTLFVWFLISFVSYILLCKIINCIIIFFFLLLQVISHKSLRQSYQTFPCAEIIFAHDNDQNGQFRCTFELTAGDATSQICVRTSIDEVKILSCLLEWSLIVARVKFEPESSSSHESSSSQFFFHIFFPNNIVWLYCKYYRQ